MTIPFQIKFETVPGIYQFQSVFFLSPRQSPEILYQDALLYAGGIFLLNGLQALTSSQYYVIAYHNAMKIRVAICGLMYRKVNMN